MSAHNHQPVHMSQWHLLLISVQLGSLCIYALSQFALIGSKRVVIIDLAPISGIYRP